MQPGRQLGWIPLHGDGGWVGPNVQVWSDRVGHPTSDITLICEKGILPSIWILWVLMSSHAPSPKKQKGQCNKAPQNEQRERLQKQFKFKNLSSPWPVVASCGQTTRGPSTGGAAAHRKSDSSQPMSKGSLSANILSIASMTSPPRPGPQLCWNRPRHSGLPSSPALNFPPSPRPRRFREELWRKNLHQK